MGRQDRRTPPDTPLRVGLLQCGHIRADVATDHGDYPELFTALLNPASLGPHRPGPPDQPGRPGASGIEMVTYEVEDGHLPAAVSECDAWLVSGSASSVYEPLPWIEATGRFLAQVVEADAPMVAVCFGHQLLARTLGGTVERSERGWGVGVHHYDVVADLPHWPASASDTTATSGSAPASASQAGAGRAGGAGKPTSLALLASHQDQVTSLPAGATVLAASHHCPVAAFSVGNRVIAVQAHPEFTPALSRDLILARREAIGPGRADAALARLDALASSEGRDATDHPETGADDTADPASGRPSPHGPLHTREVADWFRSVLSS